MMKRTYRSKKDAAGALDHRDVLLNMDEKSSAFDAFYIQNIKQTKRELSCVGSSNTYGIASKKVRKRKYVKRIVKEVENVQPRESMSVSTYLTPDKSIRVNKILDPFDELLNSSTTGQGTTEARKNDLFDRLLPIKESKTYTRKKLAKVKQFNYSSEYSSDSDKENSSNPQPNTTDIRKHELLVEPSKSPKYLDESINKIVNNISLINNFKRKNSSFNTSYKNRNKFTNNCQSPILQKSPLCSTPFKDKYRGKSIYNFSPISTKESPNYVTITEENNESNNSIVFLCKEVPKLSKEHSQLASLPKEVDITNKNQKSLYEDEIQTPLDDIEVENDIQSETTHKYSESEQSLFQITEAEPFLGFSIDKVTESDANDKNYLLKCIEEQNFDNLNTSDKEMILAEKEENRDCRREISHSNILVENNNNKKENNINAEGSLDSISEQDDDLENEKDISLSNISEEDVDASKNNNRDFNASDSKETTTDSNNSFDSDKESMYDTCESEHSFAEDNVKEPRVALERLNDSVFVNYYEKMLRDQVESSSCDSFNDESQNDESSLSTTETENEFKTEFDEINNDNQSNDSFHNCSHSNTSSGFQNNEPETENKATEIIITDSSTTEDIESNGSNNDDDIHVSFVTTRRRNENTNDSMFIFDNSYGSSSTDCDKTVLSNKARLSIFEKSDIDLDIGVNKARNSNIPELIPCSDLLQDDHHNSYINTRKSSRLRNSEDKKRDTDSNNDLTIIGDDENNTMIDMSTENIPELKTLVTEDSVAHRSSVRDRSSSINSDVKPCIVLKPGKKWERSLSIYRRMTMADNLDQSLLDEDVQKKGRKYRQSVIATMELQDSLHNESINSRRSTFISKPSRSTIRFVKDSNSSRISLNTSEVFGDLEGFLTEECDDTVIELSKLSLDSELDVTVVDNVHDTSGRIATARDYVLRRCNQTDPLLFDECYPETVLKNCHKIGEGVYGEVFLWRGRDGRARVMKIVPIAGSCKVNGEQQKDFHEVISEIVIAMELSALRAPIADIDRYFDEGKDVAALDLHAVENATDVFNEVLAVRCVQGPYPSRLLDLWELYDECKGSENDNPAALPADQQYMVLELANAGQDLESYQFTGAQQAYALFQQIAFGLAVGEEAFQFEHRDLHWGNVLIAPTEQKLATFVIRGRTYRVPRGGVRASIIDYSLSRVALPLAAARSAPRAALYNDLAADPQLFDAVGDYQFEIYRLMRDKLGNDWKNFEPYTNILWLHYTVDKMITALRYKRTNTKIHKHYIEKLKGIKERILSYKSTTEYVLTDFEI